MLYEEVEEKFPGHGLLAVGGFVFLRIISPSFVAPVKYGVVELSEFDGAARRKSILVSKIIQNISNHQLFGAKEQFMSVINEQVLANAIPRAQCLQRYLAVRRGTLCA